MKKPKIIKEIEDFTHSPQINTSDHYMVLVTPQEKDEFDKYAKENFFLNVPSIEGEGHSNTFYFGGVKFTFLVQDNLRFVAEKNSI